MPRHEQSEGEPHGRKPYTKHGSSGSGFKKTKKPAAKKTMDTQLPTSLTGCKKLLRDTTRLLNRPKMPSTKRVELERRVKMLNVLMSQMTSSQADRKNAKRYHGIKFVERKKVLRKLAQAEKESKGGDEEDEGEERMMELLVDLNYTTYYPDEFKYISLYPADPSKTAQVTKEKQRKIRESIRAAMEKGDLPRDPRLVKAEDRKAIRKANKMLLHSVSIADGVKVVEAEEGGEGSDSEESGEEGAEGSEKDAGDIEEDEFFASD